MEVKSKRIEGGRVAGINNQHVYEETILEDESITKAVVAASGQVSFSVAAETMKALSPGVYVYDIQYDNTSEVRTILEGLFKINPDVSLTA
jgi:hypothetical protein